VAKNAAYNRLYNRTTVGLGKGCLFPTLVFFGVLVLAAVALAMGCSHGKKVEPYKTKQ
jgi:hypothetical protein